MTADSHAYDASFHKFTASISFAAAEKIVPLVMGALDVRSVLDVGCAYGTWLRVWLDRGVEHIVGVDGDYVMREHLEIDLARFVNADLSRGLPVEETFDLVESLEVAEHLPAARAASFVADLTRRAPFVLFSAAPPGQGGEWHINEQPYEYWRDLFAAHRFMPVDLIRPAIQEQRDIPYWYRYNLLLYVREDVLEDHPHLKEKRVPAGVPILDYSPPLFRLRKAVVRRMPFAVCQLLARVNARMGVIR